MRFNRQANYDQQTTTSVQPRGTSAIARLARTASDARNRRTESLLEPRISRIKVCP